MNRQLAGEGVLLPGDIVLTRGRGRLSRAIRFFTRRIGESRTKVNHVGIVSGYGPLREAMVVEALHTVRLHTLPRRYGDGRSDVAVYRAADLTRPETVAIAAVARSYVGRRYGYLKIVLHLCDWLLQGAYVFRRLGRMNRYPICSWLVAHCYAKVGRNFGVKPGAASPDDIWDWVTDPNRGYACVRDLKLLTF